ncbi:MAG: glycine reductase, partial [Anaerovoracaceae bacterium]
MIRNAVIKGTGYVLIHGPDFMIHNGTTQSTERIVNPKSEYLTALPVHIRSYEQAVTYPPNQVYIGNMKPEDLTGYEFPWYDKEVVGADRYGKLGEIMPQDEFLGLVQICDVFDLVFLDKEFAGSIKVKLAAHPLLDDSILARLKDGVEHNEIVRFVEEEHAEPLYHEGKLIGYVKRGHDIDVSLTAHVLLENLVYKASGVLSLLHLVKSSGIAKEDIDYVIDCSEEACGDMNQRGGGNFAKAEAEIAGLVNATGSDTRGFCAAPTHALIEAAALVKSGTFKNVVVFA